MGEQAQDRVALSEAREMLGRTLDDLELDGCSYDIEEGSRGWDVRVQCGCLEGHRAARFHLEHELLAGNPGDAIKRRRLSRRLRAELAPCIRAMREVSFELPEVVLSTLGALSEFSATAGGSQPSRPDLLRPQSIATHPQTHFDGPDATMGELHWYALEQATQDPHPREHDLAPAEEAAMHLVRARSPRRRTVRHALATPLSAIMAREVTTAPPTAPLGDVREALLRSVLDYVVVVDEAGRVVGLLSERDMLAVASRTEAPLRAQDIMQRTPVSALEAASVREAAAALSQCRCDVLPVVDGSRQLRGVVTSCDLLCFLVDAMS